MIAQVIATCDHDHDGSLITCISLEFPYVSSVQFNMYGMGNMLSVKYITLLEASD